MLTCKSIYIFHLSYLCLTESLKQVTHLDALLCIITINCKHHPTASPSLKPSYMNNKRGTLHKCWIMNVWKKRARPFVPFNWQNFGTKAFRPFSSMCRVNFHDLFTKGTNNIQFPNKLGQSCCVLEISSCEIKHWSRIKTLNKSASRNRGLFGVGWGWIGVDRKCSQHYADW